MSSRQLAIALLLLFPGCATSIVAEVRKPADRYWAEPCGVEAVETESGYQVRILFKDGTDGGVILTEPSSAGSKRWTLRDLRHGVVAETSPETLRERPLALPRGPAANVRIAPEPAPEDGILLVPGERFHLEVWRGGVREAALDAFGTGMALRWRRHPWQALLLLAYPLAVAYDLGTAPLQLVTYPLWVRLYMGLGIFEMP